MVESEMVKALRTVRVPEEALPGTEFVVFSSDTIVETGIDMITMQTTPTFSWDYTPIDGRVKWFRDELDQVWVKFSVTANNREKIRDLVWPADRVVRVEYLKDRV